MATLKFVDDVTLTEIMDQSNESDAVGGRPNCRIVPPQFHENQYQEDQGNVIWPHL